MKLINNKGEYIICFSKDELVELWKKTSNLAIKNEINKQNFSIMELEHDSKKVQQVVAALVKDVSGDRDFHEIFSSIFIFHSFYGPEYEICYELNTKFNPNSSQVSSLSDLNKYREGTYSDFIFKSGSTLRFFQLKRFKGALNKDELLNFIKDKVLHYANNLGSVNLLILFQSPQSVIQGSIFKELYEELKKMNWKFQGQILLSYNEAMQFSVINQVYPELTTTRVPFRLPTEQ